MYVYSGNLVELEELQLFGNMLTGNSCACVYLCIYLCVNDSAWLLMLFIYISLSIYLYIHTCRNHP